MIFEFREYFLWVMIWYEDGVFPLEMVGELGALGLLGMSLHGYGCGGRSAVEYGAAVMELEAGDSGIRTFVSVQGSLSMTAIHRHGSEEQKRTWLPSMAVGVSGHGKRSGVSAGPRRRLDLIQRQ